MKMNSQLDTETDAAAALRAELEFELKNKKQCSNHSFECTQLSLDGYKFCAKHILQDKNAPYKQCSYIYSSNGKRCHLPAPRNDKKDYGYCNEHALKATLARNRQNSKYPPPNTAEVLLCSLSHYIKKPHIRSSSNTLYSEDDHTAPEDGSDLKVTNYQDPFVDIDANSIDNNHCNDVLDFCSESESDIEASTLSSVWRDMHGDSSDDESIDSEQEDVLKHANVYTAEEITLITKEKLVRLQSLYVEQYRHLQHLLKERRRRYLHSLKREKETCCNIYNQVRDNPKEQRLYKKLKALNSYHKYHGTDAILNKRIRDGRNKSADSSTKGHSKCTFTEGGVKCAERTLPLARHCRKHILEDASQVLFRPCGRINEDVECTTPIPAIFDDSSCQLHMDIPPLRSYNQPRKDSESDLDDSAEAHLQYSHFTENIKTEFMHYDIPPEIPKMETLPSLLFEESSQSMSDVPQNESIFEPDISNSNMTSRSSFADQVLNESSKNTILENTTDTTEVPERFLMEEDNSDKGTNIEVHSEEVIETDGVLGNKEVIQEEVCNMDGTKMEVHSEELIGETNTILDHKEIFPEEACKMEVHSEELIGETNTVLDHKEIFPEEACKMEVHSEELIGETNTILDHKEIFPEVVCNMDGTKNEVHNEEDIGESNNILDHKEVFPEEVSDGTKNEVHSEELIGETNSVLDHNEVIQDEVCNMDVDSVNNTIEASGDNKTSVDEEPQLEDAKVEEKCAIDDQKDNVQKQVFDTANG